MTIEIGNEKDLTKTEKRKLTSDERYDKNEQEIQDKITMLNNIPILSHINSEQPVTKVHMFIEGQKTYLIVPAESIGGVMDNKFLSAEGGNTLEIIETVKTGVNSITKKPENKVILNSGILDCKTFYRFDSIIKMELITVNEANRYNDIKKHIEVFYPK